jgi:hypothetical protein
VPLTKALISPRVTHGDIPFTFTLVKDGGLTLLGDVGGGTDGGRVHVITEDEGISRTIR